MKYYTPTELSENIKETPEGFLVCIGVPIARTGYQVYGPGETPLEVGEDGKIKILRESEEVFNPNTIASYEGKALTIGHPIDFVTPDNWKDLAKGSIQNVRKAEEADDDGEEVLLADVLVTDAFAISLVKAGLRAVSCGYEALYEQTGPGTGRQTNIIGNHLALVQAGRAGPGYQINDHKTEGLSTMSKLAEKVKSLFVKAVDEAAAAEAGKEEKMKDDEGKVEQKADGSTSYDELVKMVKDLSDKISASMGEKPKDEAPPAAPAAEKKDEPKDAEVSSSLEDRLKAVEMAVQKLLEMESKEAAGDAEDPEEMGDEDPEMTGDTAARAEILSPGIELTKDVKLKALKAAYGTKEGKAVIESLTGGKSPTFDSADQVANLFIATSELLKVARGTGLQGTKDSALFESARVAKSSDMTAEKMNEVYKAFYKNK